MSSASGSANGKAKLHTRDIPLIRGLIAEGVPNTLIGEKFGISRRTVSEINTGRTWGYVNLEAQDLPLVDALIADGMSAELIAEKFDVAVAAIVDLGGEVFAEGVA